MLIAVSFFLPSYAPSVDIVCAARLEVAPLGGSKMCSSQPTLQLPQQAADLWLSEAASGRRLVSGWSLRCGTWC
jgi:hypothetical protein